MQKVNYKDNKAENFILDVNFRKILEDGISDPELLDKFLQNHPDKSQDIKLALKIIQELHAGRYQNPELRKLSIWNHIVKQQKKQVRLRFFLYAASILLFIGIGSLSLNLLFHRPAFEKYTFLKEPYSNNTTIILADGKEICISDKQSKIHYTSNGAVVTINDSSKIDQSVKSTGINQLIVPYGKRSKIILSDGSIIWLNSGSKLVYAPVFKGKNREVFVEGEAFFEIAQDRDKLFLVHTNVFDICVIGTMFNVQVYKEDKECSAVVVNGSVNLNKIGQSTNEMIFLETHQKASLVLGQKDIKITTEASINKYVDWINGYYIFENEPLTNVLKKISRYYNINIELKLRNDDTKINGKLDLKDNPERVLEGLGIISNTNYLKNGDKYILESK